MTSLILASKNEGKVAELTELIKPFNINVLSSIDAKLPDTEETGETFFENAALKAEAACAITETATLADDSGLCVDALNGRPGVFTARHGDYTKLLEEMSDIPFGRRTAHFICVLALARPGKETIYFDGRADGFILREPRGDKGFGYDPVFLPLGQTRCYGEMLPEEKAETSHRAQALAAFIETLKTSPDLL